MSRIILAVANQADDNFVWDQLRTLQADMFAAGPVAIKVAYFGREGPVMTSRPFISTRWASDSADMVELLDRARAGCVCGCYTSIADILAAALGEAEQAPVEAIVIVGDCFHGDQTAAIANARKLRAAGSRLFFFQQSRSRHASRTESVFKALATESGGAYFQFNPAVERAAGRLPLLFEAISHCALGGPLGLEALGNEAATLLLDQITKPGGTAG
jgi:hypothetical protein